MTEDDWWELLQKSPRPWMLIELPKVDWLLYRAAADWMDERGLPGGVALRWMADNRRLASYSHGDDVGYHFTAVFFSENKMAAVDAIPHELFARLTGGTSHGNYRSYTLFKQAALDLFHKGRHSALYPSTNTYYQGREYQFDQSRLDDLEYVEMMVKLAWDKAQGAS